MSDEAPVIEMPRLWRASELKPAAQPRWLASQRVPRAAISLLIGDEGIGKSLWWVLVVAAVTTGKPLPELGIPQREPAPVILVLTEDTWSGDVLPRLLVAGADIGMVWVICTEEDGSGAPLFPRDMHVIREADPRPVLIVVDCWLDTVAASMSVRDPQQARQALHPWKEVASTTEAAVLLLGHTNRISSGNARDKYGATGALRQKARMTLFAQHDDDGHLIVGPEKANGTAPVAASRFTVTSQQYFERTDDHDGTVPLLRYVGDSVLTARQHIADTYETEHGEDSQDRAEAERWLEEFLLLEGPSVKSNEAKKAAKTVGIAERTLQRARKQLGVVIGYVGNPPVSTWTLPEAEPSTSRGTTNIHGISARQGDMPRSATEDTWHNVAQRKEQRICHEGNAVPQTHNGLPTASCPCGRPGPTDPETGLCEWCRVKFSKQEGELST
ncbi:AAA family ATPase [Mycolicibacterium sp. 120270]|uniref:AAA family ATPase n=1 Tax=Mycolicibacterium sp. 120270 TaxID=3090600 RepID=UPI00299D1718|nr:AAA family ATPase [Mycolicibacterium sp. 120270]MDX1883052.1 AAA family ATPase [Mycolicibacterium sp. 120270]